MSRSAREDHLRRTAGVLLGDYALLLGRAAEAERFYRFAEAAGGRPWQLYLAAWHQQQGRLEVAESLYRALLNRPGLWPEAWNNLGVLYGALERWPEALECYKKAVELDPAYAEAHYNLGVARWNLGDWSGVVTAFEKTLALNPAHAQAARYLEEARKRTQPEKRG